MSCGNVSIKLFVATVTRHVASPAFVSTDGIDLIYPLLTGLDSE
jgi:hypothetical protein